MLPFQGGTAGIRNTYLSYIFPGYLYSRLLTIENIWGSPCQNHPYNAAMAQEQAISLSGTHTKGVPYAWLHQQKKT